MSIDTILGIVGLVLAVIGLLTGYIFYRKGIKTKELCYDEKAVNLINGYSTQFEDLKIKFKEKDIENLSVSKILFWNNGSETIDKTDTLEDFPITICANTEKGLEILDAKVLETNNIASNFSAVVLNGGRYVVLSFEYLDSQDGAIIQIIHTGAGAISDLFLIGRIKGAKKVSWKTVEKSNLISSVTIFLWFMLVAPIFGVTFYEVFIAKSSIAPLALNVIILVLCPVGIFLMLYRFFSENKNRAKLPKGITQFK
jgi:hypothetical protein